jgi:hypothetical protein
LTLHRSVRGYGLLTWNARNATAHKIAYELEVGAIPKGKHLLHLCDTPSCVRPDHLQPGSHDDNVADKAAKGRQARGADIRKSSLTDQNVLRIRAIYDTAENRYGLVKQLAAEYGLQVLAVHRIVARKTWRHLP